jgi:malonyl-CoA decarboxylase
VRRWLSPRTASALASAAGSTSPRALREEAADGQRAHPLLLRLSSAFGHKGTTSPAQRVLGHCRELLAQADDISCPSIADMVVDGYPSLDDGGKLEFFGGLAGVFAPNTLEVRLAAQEYVRSGDPKALRGLQQAVCSPRLELFRRISLGRRGLLTLIGMRADVRRFLPSHDDWHVIDDDLVSLFKSWFGRGLLVLRRIDWNTSAHVLEQLIKYEAVHQIAGWADLRRRLESDRRCYAYFHPAIPDEPLTFVEVALTRQLSTSIEPLLDPTSPVEDVRRTRCAVFYSITSCHDGLRGVSFGGALIHRVAEDVAQGLPAVRCFATLSPIPSLVQWLRDARQRGERRSTALSRWLDEHEQLPAPPESLRREICQAAAHYLLNAKRGLWPFDPVARFHLANGARIDRLNWLADTSHSGLQRSMGLMVNYVYPIGADVEQNRRRYAMDHEVVASRRMRRLAQRPATP